MTRILKLAAQLAAIVYVALFALRNAEPVSLDLVLFELESLPVCFVVLLAMGCGALAATALLGASAYRLRGQRRLGERRILELEQELHGMRTLPLTRGGGDEPDAVDSTHRSERGDAREPGGPAPE